MNKTYTINSVENYSPVPVNAQLLHTFESGLALSHLLFVFRH